MLGARWHGACVIARACENHFGTSPCVHACVRMCACARACVRACVRASVCACVCASRPAPSRPVPRGSSSSSSTTVASGPDAHWTRPRCQGQVAATSSRRRTIFTELGWKQKRARRDLALAEQWGQSGGHCLWGYCWSGVVFQRFLDQRSLDAFRVACCRARRHIFPATIESCRDLLDRFGLWRPLPLPTVVDSSGSETVIELSDEDIGPS